MYYFQHLLEVGLVGRSRHLDFIYLVIVVATCAVGRMYRNPDKSSNTDMWSCTMIYLLPVCLFVFYVTGKMVHPLRVNASCKVDDILCCKVFQVSSRDILLLQKIRYLYLHLYAFSLFCLEF